MKGYLKTKGAKRNSMIYIAICDDERAEISYLTSLVRKWAAARGVIVRLTDYESAESFLFAYEDSEPVDILLLDIQMKAMDGVELARQIRRDGNALEEGSQKGSH